MKNILAGALLAAALISSAGCTNYTAIAQGPSADKVFVTKTTSYIIWTTNKMLLCDFAGTTAKNCAEVSQD